MYLESSGIKLGSYARLMSPVLVPDQSTETICLAWKYHMYGSQMGTLQIRSTVRWNASLFEIWERVWYSYWIKVQRLGLEIPYV